MKTRMQGQEKLRWYRNEFKLSTITNKDKSRWICEEEWLCLYQTLQAHRIERFIECGTANGFSSMVARQAMLDAGVKEPDVHTWDIVDRPKAWAADDKFITFHHEDFADGISKFYDLPINTKMTAYFIDGDHSRAAVKRDWKAIEPWLLATDVVIFHDAQDYAWINRLVFNILSTVSEGHEYEGGIVTTPRGMGIVRVL